MSESQLPTDEPTPSVEDANPSTPQEDVPSLDEVEIGGLKVPLEEVNQTWGKMQAAHTQRSQALADERRDLERQREEFEAQRNSQPSRSSRSEDDDDDPVSKLLEGQNKLLGRMDAWEQRQQDSMAKLELEESKLAAVQSYRNKPLYDEDAMLTYMEQNGLNPNQANVAYNALTGFRAGMSVGEQQAAARRAVPVMGSSGSPGVSPEITSPRDVIPAPAVGSQSWQDLDELAAGDDSIR